ncbi:DUF6396 domain-containing protein [Klebsiella pneumoniae]
MISSRYHPRCSPEWDGKLKWLEEREANVPPPKPSAALIEKLAKAKQLNPATGRPLPTSPDSGNTTGQLASKSVFPARSLNHHKQKESPAIKTLKPKLITER